MGNQVPRAFPAQECLGCLARGLLSQVPGRLDARMAMSLEARSLAGRSLVPWGLKGPQKGVESLRESREKVSITLDRDLLTRVRRAFPGVPLSHAIGFLLEKALAWDALEKRLASLDAVSRAALLLLADYAAGWDEKQGRVLLNRYVQRALARLKGVERRASQADPGQEQGEGQGSGA